MTERVHVNEVLTRIVSDAIGSTGTPTETLAVRIAKELLSQTAEQLMQNVRDHWQDPDAVVRDPKLFDATGIIREKLSAHVKSALAEDAQAARGVSTVVNQLISFLMQLHNDAVAIHQQLADDDPPQPVAAPLTPQPVEAPPPPNVEVVLPAPIVPPAPAAEQ